MFSIEPCITLWWAVQQQNSPLKGRAKLAEAALFGLPMDIGLVAQGPFPGPAAFPHETVTSRRVGKRTLRHKINQGAMRKHKRSGQRKKMGRLFGRPVRVLGRNLLLAVKIDYQMTRHTDLAPCATSCGVRLAPL